MELAVKQNSVTTAVKKQGSFFGKKTAPPFFAPALIQPKLTIGPVDDPYEREADAVADKVMRMSDSETLQTKPSMATVQRKCFACEQEDKVQMKAGTGTMGGFAVPPSVEKAINSLGDPLDASTRDFMEQRFGYDFSYVQIHNDAEAHRSANEINALAYAYGSHIVFGKGQYNPQTLSSTKLLAHELTHVVQQNALQAVCQSGTGVSEHIKTDKPYDGGKIFRQAGPSPLTIPAEGVDMPWVGFGTASSELGYLRDAQYFWTRFLAAYPEQLSGANQMMIAGRRSPVVDATWVSYHPEHSEYMGDILEHHHVGQGSRAVPMPKRLHAAYTVFHPQRKEVGTPQKGASGKLPEQPTRAQAQAEIDRHVREGRIRGPGVTKARPPKAPEIPPASEVAGVPSAARRAQNPLPASAMGLTEGIVPAGKSPAAVPEPATPPKAGGRVGGIVGGVAGIALPLIVGWVHQKAVAKRYAERAKEEGYVPRGASSGEGILYDIGSWVLDPFNDADKSVGTSGRFDFNVWRARIRSTANSKKTGETFTMGWDVGVCRGDDSGHQIVEQRVVVYQKQSNGTWVVKEGDVSGIPDLNSILSDTVSDEVLNEIITTNPCMA